MLEAMGSKIIVELELKEEKIGMIVIPDVAKKEKVEGLVVSIGEAVGNDFPFHLEVGDRILFGKYSGDDIERDGKTYKIINQDDVLAKIL